jgi:serine/threonine-protein kinase
MLHHELVYQPQFSERFRNEAKIVAHLRHPHIVEVFDLEEAYATFFIIMEKVKGIELQHVLETRGKLSIAETRQILRQLLEALDFAHEKGVIHRDIKPTNIMLDDTGNVKLMDFGIAYLPKNTSGPDEEDMLLGTPHYMSPEQHTCGQIDERTDIYALGLLAYHMLTGELPFEGSVKEIEAKKRKTPYLNIKKGPKDLPEDLIAFIKHATARKHEDRAPNCKALLNLLASQDAGYTLSQITAKTITFTYPKEQQHVVRALLEKYKKQADAISHITSHTNHPS